MLNQKGVEETQPEYITTLCQLKIVFMNILGLTTVESLDISCRYLERWLTDR